MRATVSNYSGLVALIMLTTKLCSGRLVTLLVVLSYFMKLYARVQNIVGVKAIKYSAVSAITVALSQIILFVLFGLVRRWSATSCNVVATATTAVPGYYLNRAWVWGKTGKSHFMKEVAPFWVLTFLGLVLSLIAVAYAHDLAEHLRLSHLVDAIFVNLAALFAFGVLWIGKYIVFNRFLFGSGAVTLDAEAM
jgi:putative flippase GtrA